MNLNFMYTFLEIVRNKSISGAAKSLYVSQTTVSQRLNDFEKQLGFKLLDRGKGIKKIKLTLGGEEFYKLAKGWEHLYNEMELLKLQGPNLTLNIGSIDSFNTFVLPEVYKRINKSNTPIFIKSSTLHSDELYAEVENKNIDVGFSLRKRSVPNVNVEKYYESPLVLIRPYIKDAPEVIEPSELVSENELFMPWGDEYEMWHQKWWNPLGSKKMGLDDIHLLLNLLDESNHWAIVPKWIADYAKDRYDLMEQKLTDTPPNYVCYRLTQGTQTSLKKEAIDIFTSYFDDIHNK